MNTNIWSSAQMAGTGGALKALVKNLATKLKLNRSDMKRVVARVISERHGYGDVGDYNGHMFFVKPDRIDMSKQITHSKDAFDEMFKTKPLPTGSSKGQLRTPRSMSETRINTYHMPSRLKAKSLTGVKINRHHFKRRNNPNEIVVQMSTALLRSKSRLGFKRFLTSQAGNQIKRQLQLNRKNMPNEKPYTRTYTKLKVLSKIKSLHKLGSKGKLLAKSKSAIKPVDKLRNRKLKLAKRQPRDQALTPIIARLPAGHTIAKAVLNAYQEDTPLTEMRPRKKSSDMLKKVRATSEQKKSAKKATKPKSVKKKTEKKSKRLTAGSMRRKSSRNMLVKSQKSRHWCNPYQFPGGAGATQQPNPRNSAMVLKRSKSTLKGKQVKRIKQTFVIRSTRNKRSQSRLLTQQLKDEEPIDEPERLYAGNVRHVKQPKRISYKVSSRLVELAKPALHRCVFPELVHGRSCPHLRQSSHKLKKARRRSRRLLLDSSHGSLADARGTSGSGLTPAKRNLTLAFMKKDGVRTPGSPRSVLWK